MNERAIDRIMRQAEDYYREHNQEDNQLYQPHKCHFDIQSYYHAWTLRGDDPQCYACGYFRQPSSYTQIMPEKAFQVLKSYPIRYSDRYIPEYSILNYLYQYSRDVYVDGCQNICVKIPQHYIQSVKAVQADMRRSIAEMGLTIETNPTSNVLISTFRSYQKHPLSTFFNRGLPVTAEEDNDCAQLSVSINTDNSGVFYTSLENEYALLVREMESIVDENGKRRYTSYDIHTWIDHIRVMGLEQSFQFVRDPHRPDENDNSSTEF